MKSDLRHVIYALSDALDLVGVDDVAHGKRVAIMAAECARVMGHSEPEAIFMFDLGMLHDIGVSSTQTHRHLVGEFDWESSQIHAEFGHELLRGYPPLAPLALPVRYHHTHWDRLAALPESELSRSQAEQANLIYLVDRVDALAAPYYGGDQLFEHVEEIRQRIRGHAGVYFSPALVEVFLAASAAEVFWLRLEPRAIQACLQDLLAHGERYRATFAELKQLAYIFARIVDAKSPYTAEHSLGVAGVARFLAGRMGLPEESCDKLEIAGLLHDLGKLRIPDEILDKQGGLDLHERRIINAHSFESFQILRNIEGFEDIALWAAYHHEDVGGTGYPFHIRGEGLPLEARILRVADIFQAMAQNRPYRSGWGAQAVLAFLDQLAHDGHLDAEVVAVTAAHLPEVMAAALPDGP
jgi:HD-GYP domain-containing protein (c-di-GMP phosphodiesterase class II)